MPLRYEEKERLRTRRLHKPDSSDRTMGVHFYWTCPECELVLSHENVDAGAMADSERAEEEPYLEEAKAGHLKEHEEQRREQEDEKKAERAEQYWRTKKSDYVR